MAPLKDGCSPAWHPILGLEVHSSCSIGMSWVRHVCKCGNCCTASPTESARPVLCPRTIWLCLLGRATQSGQPGIIEQKASNMQVASHACKAIRTSGRDPSPLIMILVTMWSCSAFPSSVALVTTLVSGPWAILRADGAVSSARAGDRHADSSSRRLRPTHARSAMGCAAAALTCNTGHNFEVLPISS